MTCSVCRKWAPTSLEQLELRRQNLALMSNATPVKCPSCGDADWVLSTELIDAARDPAWWRWLKSLFKR